MRNRAGNPSDSSGRNTPAVSDHSTAGSASSTYTGMTEDHELEQASTPLHSSPSVLQCMFSFLWCNFASSSESTWRSHCIEHFQRLDPPSHLPCFLCDDFVAVSERHTTVWVKILDHIASRHVNGQNTTRTLPPESILSYLAQNGIISNVDLTRIQLTTANQGCYIQKGEESFGSQDISPCELPLLAGRCSTPK